MRFCAPTTRLTRLSRNSSRNPPKIDYLFRDERLLIFEIRIEIRRVSIPKELKSEIRLVFHSSLARPCSVHVTRARFISWLGRTIRFGPFHLWTLNLFSPWKNSTSSLLGLLLLRNSTKKTNPRKGNRNRFLFFFLCLVRGRGNLPLPFFPCLLPFSVPHHFPLNSQNSGGSDCRFWVGLTL